MLQLLNYVSVTGDECSWNIGVTAEVCTAVKVHELATENGCSNWRFRVNNGPPLKAITALELEEKVDEMGKRGILFEVILIKNLLRTKGV